MLHVSTGIYQTNNLKNIVLDEADTLLDDSFNQVTLRIIRKLKVITFWVLQLQLSHYHYQPQRKVMFYTRLSVHKGKGVGQIPP